MSKKSERNGTAPISREDAEDWTAGLGQVFSGGWRLIHLAQRQGVPAALGLTTEEWVRDRLGGYVRLSLEERRGAAAELAGEGLSQSEIAGVLGVNQATVSRDLSDANASDEDAVSRDDAGDRVPDDANASDEDAPDESPDEEDAAPPTAEAAAPEEMPTKGKAMHWVNEAVNCLNRIPRKDPQRKFVRRALEGWMKANL